MADTIKVRKKANPSVTRTIQLKALPVFQKRGWEAAEATPTATITEVKKKPVVEPVAAPVTNDVPETETEKEPEAPFAPVDDTPDNTIDDLRGEYKTLTGKDADKRWSVKRLTDEIAKLNS